MNSMKAGCVCDSQISCVANVNLENSACFPISGSFRLAFHVCNRIKSVVDTPRLCAYRTSVSSVRPSPREDEGATAAGQEVEGDRPHAGEREVPDGDEIGVYHSK